MRVIFFLFFATFMSSSFGQNTNWMDEAIEKDFDTLPSKTKITKELIEKTWKTFKGDSRFKRYQIINSKVYGPQTYIRDLLEAITYKYQVPDVDFIYFHHDILRERDFKNTQYSPIFVSAKDSSKTPTILFIDWYYSILDKPPELEQFCHKKNLNPGWNSLIKIINENVNLYAWSDKKEVAFWRGSAFDANYSDYKKWTNYPRGKAVYISKYLRSDLLDARFSFIYENCKELIKKQGIAPFSSPLDQLQYKYLLDIDGVTCTYPSLQWKLLSGCLVLKQVTDDRMWYYYDLKPWVHYIPIKQDLSDLVEKILWAKEHDTECFQIAQNARQFVLTHLMPEDILEYCYKVLLKYASYQDS